MNDRPFALTVRWSESAGEVEGLLLRPDDARWLMVLAHGAGAGMHHPFMEGLAQVLAGCGIATLRYQFPYMQQRRRRPDASGVLIATVETAVGAACRTAADLPLLAGGKSLGGRMTSLACAGKRSAVNPDMALVRGLVLFGFPLHPAGRPGTGRAEHLSTVQVPMLFLQGTRDPLADLDLLRPVCAELAPRATLHVVAGADHSFHMLKRSGRTDRDVLNELARTVASWAEALS
jgi:predicted alpha/beta-hydrolase family hydrolase